MRDYLKQNPETTSVLFLRMKIFPLFIFNNNCRNELKKELSQKTEPFIGHESSHKPTSCDKFSVPLSSKKFNFPISI